MYWKYHRCHGLNFWGRSNEPTRLVNTVESWPIMNGIRKFCTTDRLKN